MKALYCVYHYVKGYYNFRKGKYDNNHDFNFDTTQYTTEDKILAISVCPYRGASMGTI